MVEAGVRSKYDNTTEKQRRVPRVGGKKNILG
jgi:hypothetical protein